MKAKTRLLLLRGISFATLGALAAFTVAFVAVNAVRGTFSWSELPWGLLTVFLGFTLFAGVIAVASQFIGKRRENIFLTLADAMRRIAEGDFDVTVSIDEHDKNNFIGQVVTGLNDMAGALKKMESMRQEFVSDVSHEIQSPLTSIAGFARALRDGDLPAEQEARYLDIIEAESRRLSRLADSLLRLSALDARTQEMSPREFRLDAQLRSVVLACESQWQEKGIEVSAELEPLSISGDEAMLVQVWSNLVHNAVKFTAPGGRIVVSLCTEQGLAVVRVRDSGIGIGNGDLPQVFDRFFKADKSRTNANGAGGSGLGLSIAQRIVTLHRGGISAESPGLGKGSTFTVRLPRG
jgi:two-component system, OmpR family, phosphate regulon sensor histidine kinase PhoR